MRTILRATPYLILIAAGLLATGAPARLAAAHPCPPGGYTLAELAVLRDNGFAIDDDARRNGLAAALLACTGDPDPAIRDGIVYEGLASWLRSQQLAPETIDTLRAGLLAQLQAADDAAGFRKPFAALLLSEVVRSDRIEPAFTAAQREQLVQAADSYLRGIRDYRGFSPTEGWRHGVAHGADLVLQLALNRNIDSTQLRRLLAAVASQVAPPGAVFYIYGEPQRLARAVFHAHRRGDLNPADWSDWLHDVTDPRPLTTWSEAFASQAGLARRHNTLAFLQALYFAASTAGDESGAELATQVMEAIGRTQG